MLQSAHASIQLPVFLQVSLSNNRRRQFSKKLKPEMKGLCPMVLLGCVVAITQGRYLLVDLEETEPGKCKH